MLKKMDVYTLAERLGSALLKRKLNCAVAESCTGGSLAAAMTDIPGSSQWFERGFVTYSNKAKTDMLGVDHFIIASEGAVSESTVRAMAEGALIHSEADVSIAITGIAGPAGGGPDKPVGTVWIACALDLRLTKAQCYLFKGDRAAIRQQAVQTALDELMRLILNKE